MSGLTGHGAGAATFAVVLAANAWLPVAHSQESAAAALTEVVVTAQRRTENLQQVPISISAFSSQQLEAANIGTSADLEHITPNLIFAESGRDGQIFIRGVGSTRLSGAGADPSSATYVDGVYRSRGVSSLVELLDIQRVEVLRGPQGTLYGRNSTGGAVRYVSEDPASTFGGKVTAELGNYDQRKILGQLDVPLIGDQLWMRAVVLHDEHTGYTRNLEHPGETFGRKNLTAGRVTLKYKPADNFDITLHAGKSRDNSDQTALKQFIDPLGPFGRAQIISDPRTVRADFGPREAPIDNGYVDATINWDVGAVRLTSITGFVSVDVGPFSGDLDNTEIAGVTDGDPRNHVLGIEDGGHSLTQEFNVASRGDGPFQWVAGTFYLKDDNKTLRQGLYVPLIPVLAANHRTVNAFETTNNYAAFGNGSYQLTDKIRFTAGVRYSHERKEIERAQYVNLTLTTGPQFDAKSWNSLTPKFVLDYKVNDDAMTYASYSKGFKSGAFNASNFDPAVNPEYINAYEVGTKTRWLDRRLTLDMAAFKYHYTDLQVQSLDPNNIGTEIVRNAAGADLEGAELEATWLATSRFLVNASAAWLNAQYSDFPTLAGNLRGHELPNAPKWSGNLGLQYTMPLGEAGDIKFNGNYFVSAQRFLSEYNNPITDRQGFFSLVDARASWNSPDDRWNLAFYGKNLADRVVFSRTITQASLLRNGYLAYIEPPRTFGLDLTLRF
jgi:iron complex outermembrane receptor protein